MNLNRFKPQLAPNNKVDNDSIDWESRLVVPSHYDISEKLDGIRLEIIFDKSSKCIILTRNMKPFRSVFIKKLEFQLQGALRDCIIEAEIHCEGMRFNEIQHFISTINVFDHLSRLRRLEDKVHSDMFNTVKWPFPGRTASWLCRYDHPFTINIFDIHKLQNEMWIDRKDRLFDWAYNALYKRNQMFRLINHYRFDTVKEIDQMYRSVVESGGEGLILKHESNRYKYGRITLNQKTLFKMKEDNILYVGTITNVLRGTVVDPFIEGGINELGYATTSQRKEDRIPSNKAKGFEVILEDNNKLTVTLKGFNDVDKKELLNKKHEWIGRDIQFLAMKPTKVNGVPRHAKYIKQ